jgi:hypothetical protein
MAIRINQGQKNWDAHQFKGLKDGGIVTLQCKLCDAPLVDVWVTLPDETMITEIVAKCPHCNGQSFSKKFSGSYHLGHTNFTTMIDFEMKGDVLTVLTAKGGQKWKV